jgi:hypothetical protein
MDEQLLDLRRAHEAMPSDLAAALRLAASGERAGDVALAWTVLARAHTAADRRAKTELTLALGHLADREPRALLEHLSGLEAKPARRAFELLASTGEVPVLVAIACERHGAHKREAREALRATLGLRWKGLPHPHELVARRAPRVGRHLPRPSSYEVWLIKKAQEGRVMALAPWLLELEAWDAFEAVCGRVLPLEVEALAATHRARMGRVVV